MVAGWRVGVLVAHGAGGHLVVALGAGAGLVGALRRRHGVRGELVGVVPAGARGGHGGTTSPRGGLQGTRCQLQVWVWGPPGARFPARSTVWSPAGIEVPPPSPNSGSRGCDSPSQSQVLGRPKAPDGRGAEGHSHRRRAGCLGVVGLGDLRGRGVGVAGGLRVGGATVALR